MVTTGRGVMLAAGEGADGLSAGVRVFFVECGMMVGNVSTFRTATSGHWRGKPGQREGAREEFC